MYRIGNGAKGTNLLGVYDNLKTLEKDISSIHFLDNYRYILLRVDDEEESLEDVLASLKVDTNTRGGIFIRDAINLALDNKDIIEKPTINLYPVLGEKYSCDSATVEKAIRSTIEKSWNNIPEDVKVRIFGDFSVFYRRPSNRAYLRCVLQYLK